MAQNLEGKRVLVTGATGGIGHATAIAFAKAGCSVAIHYKSDENAAQAVLTECNHLSSGNSIVPADLSLESEVAHLFDEIKQQFGGLDVLVNNAGIFDESDGPTNVAAFENVFRNNFLSAVLVTKYALPLMQRGSIINVSSIHGRLGEGAPESIAYSAGKAALESYTLNLAKAVAPDIRANAIAPGRVLTKMWGDPSAKEIAELGTVHLIKRMIMPEEIANGIIFLATNEAVCGTVLTIDSGMGLMR